MLSGAGIDEFITRTDAGTGATSTFLTDALGSPVALANASGVVQTEYTYEPFGNTSASGSSNSSSYQYTGRENDSTGLHYYQARYYHPALQRFISEDPIEFDGGDTNLYAYVWNNPLSYTDPSGENPWATFAGACAVGAATGVATEFGFGYFNGRKPTPSQVGSAAVSGCAVGMAGLGLAKVFSAIKAAAKAVEKGAATGKRGFSAADRAAGLEKAKDAAGTPHCQYCGTELSPKSGRPNSYEADHRSSGVRSCNHTILFRRNSSVPARANPLLHCKT